MKTDVLFSHQTDEWYTPKEIYKVFMDRGGVEVEVVPKYQLCNELVYYLVTLNMR